MKTQQLTNNKYYLTRAQFEARKLAGTLEVGSEYYITDDSFYTKPASGIPETDLSSTVNASLDLADSAVQNLSDLSITATSTEINVLDGITATTTELNMLSGTTEYTATEIDTLWESI